MRSVPPAAPRAVAPRGTPVEGEPTATDRDAFARVTGEPPPAPAEPLARAAEPLAARRAHELFAERARGDRYRDAPLGEHLGSGGHKDVFALLDSPAEVIAILKPSAPADILREEVALLRKLRRAGLPAAETVAETTHGSQPALVMKRYAEGSKAIVRISGKRPAIVGSSAHLNERSIRDLERIRATMQRRQIRVSDLQFLIGRDGRVVIADPLDVTLGKPPTRTNLQTIELMIRAARAAVAARAEGPS